jgi:hypothetical protein
MQIGRRSRLLDCSQLRVPGSTQAAILSPPTLAYQNRSYTVLIRLLFDPARRSCGDVRHPNVVVCGVLYRQELSSARIFLSTSRRHALGG